MDPTTWIPALLVFVAVASLAVSGALAWELLRAWYRRRSVSRRLETIMEEERSGAPELAGLLLRDPSDESGDAAERLAMLPGVRNVLDIVRQSGSSWSAQSFFLLTLGGALAGGVALFVPSGSLAVSVAGAVGGGFLPYAYLRRQRSRRLRLFEEDFPEAIDLLTRAIRAGHPLSTGMRMVGQEMGGPVAEEFRQSSEEQRFGLAFEDAVLGLVDRVDLTDVRIFATAILVQKEIGGNLAEILENLAETIRARFKIRRQIRVYTAQGRMSSWVLGALPVTMAIMLYFIEPEYVSMLWTEFLGRFMLVTAVTLQLLGFWWIRKIVNLDV